MAETFKGYYLPPSLADVERKLEMEERPLGDARLIVPRLKPEDAYAIASTLRENRSKIATMPPADIADIIRPGHRSLEETTRGRRSRRR